MAPRDCTGHFADRRRCHIQDKGNVLGRVVLSALLVRRVAMSKGSTHDALCR